jgi:hypothetical protein
MYPYTYTIVNKDKQKNIIESEADERVMSSVIALVVDSGVNDTYNIIEILRNLNYKTEYVSSDKTFDLESEGKMRSVLNRYYNMSTAQEFLAEGFVMSHPNSQYDYIRDREGLLYGFYSGSSNNLTQLTADEIKVLSDGMDWYVVDIRTYLK